MKYDDFLEEVKSIAGYQFKDKETNGYSGKKTPIEPILTVEWSTGGTTGGSCYGDGDNHYGYSSDDPPAELDSLDTILAKYRPKLPFLEYKKLCGELIEYDFREEDEYYGNSRNYSIKKVKVRALYDYMVERKCKL